MVNKNEMFCFQCEQAAKGIACTKVGVCGKLQIHRYCRII